MILFILSIPSKLPRQQIALINGRPSSRPKAIVIAVLVVIVIG